MLSLNFSGVYDNFSNVKNVDQFCIYETFQIWYQTIQFLDAWSWIMMRRGLDDIRIFYFTYLKIMQCCLDDAL